MTEKVYIFLCFPRVYLTKTNKQNNVTTTTTTTAYVHGISYGHVQLQCNIIYLSCIIFCVNVTIRKNGKTVYSVVFFMFSEKLISRGLVTTCGCEEWTTTEKTKKKNSITFENIKHNMCTIHRRIDGKVAKKKTANSGISTWKLARVTSVIKGPRIQYG